MPLGLVLHEMVTNAVKYGAWARAGGLLEVRWQDVDGRVRLVWREESEDAPPPPEGGKPEREGFGSMLMRSSALQLGGTIERRFEAAGIARRLRVQTHSAVAVCELVRAGLGVAIVNPLTAAACTGGGLIVRPLTVSIPYRVSALIPLHRPAQPLAAELVSLLRSARRR